MDENHASSEPSKNELAGQRDPERPERIGPYRILDTLGEGGMAIVYLAEQKKPVKRRVALKVLKPGMDTKQVVARFESERQALAVLDHPNIAKVFDGGVTEFGRQYFVMEWVHGIPITDYCDDHRLNTEQRVELFVEVCSAVQHAHHKGLIHRDIKPSNLLVAVVDDRPQVKVIDFGIAKATGISLTEQTLVTKIGQIIGTPQYMSPEQADMSGLDVDTRTDIYSLGVVLYELLVGVVPLDLTAVADQAVRIALREKDPRKPSTRIDELGDTRDEIAAVRHTDSKTLKRQLKGDLDWIVMQAIAKDRTHRYETANALAMECKRYLNHQPVIARPPSAGYLLQRFIRRNRLMVTAAAIAVIAVLAGATAATLGFIRASEAEKVAVQEAETAGATTQFLVDLFQVSNPWSFTPVSAKSGADITAREVLDMGADRIRNELQSQPEVQSALMVAIGRVYLGLGLPEQAKSLIIGGLAVRRETYPPGHIAIGDGLLASGLLHLTTGDYKQALADQREGIAIYENAWGNDVLGLAWMLSQLSVILSNNGEHQEALEVQLRSLEILHTNPERAQFDLGQALNNLGYLQNGMGLDEESRVTFLEAVDVLSQTEARGLYSRALANLAAAYMLTGRLARSQELQEEALAIKRDWFGADHIEVGYSVANLSYIHTDFEEFEQSETLKREAITIFSKHLGESHPNIGIILGGLAANMVAQKKYTDAEATYFDALSRIQTSYGANSMAEVPIQIGMGTLYGRQDRFEEAELHFREALRIIMSINAEHSYVAVARAGIAKLPLSTLNVEEREQYFSEAIAQLLKTEGPNTPRVTNMQMDFAAFLMEQGEASRAQTLFRTGLEHLGEAIPVDHPRYLRQVGRYEELFGGQFGP